MNWKVFRTRTLSAIVYAVIMIFGLWYSEPVAIFALAFLILFLTSKELFALTDRLLPRQKSHWLQWIIALILSIYFIIALLDKQFFTVLPLIGIATIILTSIVLIPERYRLGNLSIILTMIYLAIPMACLIELRGIDRYLPLGIIALIWINDTMAYIIGSFIGKTPLSTISPKKTWEGTIGGILLTILIGMMYGHFGKTNYESYHWAVLAGIVAIFGNLGDLIESLFKRMAKVKDSGNIMPGHGGALDRFDSVLAVLPVALVYIYYFI